MQSHRKVVQSEVRLQVYRVLPIEMLSSFMLLLELEFLADNLPGNESCNIALARSVSISFINANKNK